MILGFARDTLVVVEKDVIDVLSRHAQTGKDATEAGGILIGSYRGPHVEVCGCTAPMPGDRRLRHVFDRMDPGHDRAAREAWWRSQHTQTYVGEWHTHPEDQPLPSWLDRRTWYGVMRKHREGPVLFLIVGRRGFWAGLGSRGTVLAAVLVQAEAGEGLDRGADDHPTVSKASTLSVRLGRP